MAEAERAGDWEKIAAMRLSQRRRTEGIKAPGMAPGTEAAE